MQHHDVIRVTLEPAWITSAQHYNIDKRDFSDTNSDNWWSPYNFYDSGGCDVFKDDATSLYSIDERLYWTFVASFAINLGDFRCSLERMMSISLEPQWKESK